MFISVTFFYCYVHHKAKNAENFIMNVLRHGKYIGYIKNKEDKDINIIKKELVKRQYNYIKNINLEDLIISITKLTYQKYPYYSELCMSTDKDIYDFLYVNI